MSYLRRFRKLQTLNMCGNPISEQADCKLFIIAHLPFLEYLDYRLVDEASVSTVHKPRFNSLVNGAISACILFTLNILLFIQFLQVLIKQTPLYYYHINVFLFVLLPSQRNLLTSALPSSPFIIFNTSIISLLNFALPL